MSYGINDQLLGVKVDGYADGHVKWKTIRQTLGQQPEAVQARPSGLAPGNEWTLNASAP